MYVQEFADKVTAALQANAVVDHAALIGNLTHQERLGVLDTIREMERQGKLKRDMTQRDATTGKLVLRYVRVG